MAKIDDVIDRLQEINTEILKLKRSISLLAPLPKPLKAGVRQGQDLIDPILQELYFDALRGGLDLARDPQIQEATVRTIQSATRPRSRAQKQNDKMQSQAFVVANTKLRKKNGELRKGKTQSDVAKTAQKELKKMKLAKRPNKGGRPAKKRTSTGSSRARSGGGRR